MWWSVGCGVWGAETSRERGFRIRLLPPLAQTLSALFAQRESHKTLNSNPQTLNPKP